MLNPFENISSLQKEKLFKLLGTHTYTYEKSEEILPTLKTENIICILLEGSAYIVSMDYNGEEYITEKLYENSVFGTSISGIDHAEYQIRTIEKCKVLVIDYKKLINNQYITYKYYNIFITNLLDIATNKLKENNNRTKILTRKSIRDKLLAYFENEYKRTLSRNIYLPYNFKDLADYLSVNRSAMFRELKNLKEEKFIKIVGKRITLLYVPNI